MDFQASCDECSTVLLPFLCHSLCHYACRYWETLVRQCGYKLESMWTSWNQCERKVESMSDNVNTSLSQCQCEYKFRTMLVQVGSNVGRITTKTWREVFRVWIYPPFPPYCIPCLPVDENLETGIHRLPVSTEICACVMVFLLMTTKNV